MVRVFGDYLCRDGEYIWKLVLYRGGGGIFGDWFCGDGKYI